MIAKLRLSYDIPDDAQTAVRIAALLHDIGHGPFSHVIESILGFHHEEFTIKAVLSDETEIGRLLARFSPDLAADVASIIRGDYRHKALAQLVSSQLDVDRMDYLLRDSLMTAARFADFVLERADPARMTELRSLYGSKVSTSAERDPAPSDHGVL